MHLVLASNALPIIALVFSGLSLAMNFVALLFRDRIVEWLRRPILNLRVLELTPFGAKLAVSNDPKRLAAEDVQVVVVDFTIPPRVHAERPINIETTERIRLPLKWADASADTDRAVIPPGVERPVSFFRFEDPPKGGQKPLVKLDVLHAGSDIALSLDNEMVYLPDELLDSVPGLRGLEDAPASMTVAVRARNVPESRYTLLLNYDGYWPFAPTLPDRPESHFSIGLYKEGEAPSFGGSPFDERRVVSPESDPYERGAPPGLTMYPRAEAKRRRDLYYGTEEERQRARDAL